MADNRKARQQAIFDKVWQYFVVDKKPFNAGRYAGTPRPSYRSANDARSIYGLFIDDAKYTPSLEELLPANLFWEGVLGRGVTGADAILLDDLQNAYAGSSLSHEGKIVVDPSAPKLSLEERLRRIGNDYGLEVPS